jgi:hypothetical protein
MILTRDEIVELTGKQRLPAQVRVLDALAVPYRRRPDGTIVIFREAIHHAPPQDRPTSPRLRLP